METENKNILPPFVISTRNFFVNLFNGKFLENGFSKRTRTAVYFAVTLLILYTTNVYDAHQRIKENESLEKEIKELRASYVSLQKKLIQTEKSKNIENLVAEHNLNLGFSKRPPYAISEVE